MGVGEKLAHWPVQVPFDAHIRNARLAFWADDMDAMEIPTSLREAYRAWAWEVAWDYYPDTITFRLRHPSGPVRFLKVARSSLRAQVRSECERMRWARRHLPVPEVIDCGSEGHLSWLITAEIPGRDATHQVWKTEPDRLVRLLAEALRRFHRVPVEDCPYDFRIDSAIAHVRARVAAGEVDSEVDFHNEHRHLSPHQALEYLEQHRPATEDLVVCHGDYCFPNIVLGEWKLVGFLDLGELGVADRWWDLAVATWSTRWNLGPGWEKIFLDAYGIKSDARRIAYFRLLYDLAS